MMEHSTRKSLTEEQALNQLTALQDTSEEVSKFLGFGDAGYTLDTDTLTLTIARRDAWHLWLEIDELEHDDPVYYCQ